MYKEYIRNVCWAHWVHSFAGPKGPGPIGPFLKDSFEEVIDFCHFFHQNMSSLAKHAISTF